MSTTRPVEIRLGAVKRLTKELLTRRIDVGTEKARLDRFIAEGKDRWDVGKQKEVLAESEKMVPDATKRLEAGVAELNALAEAAAAELTDEKKGEIEEAVKAAAKAVQG